MITISKDTELQVKRFSRGGIGTFYINGVGYTNFYTVRQDVLEKTAELLQFYKNEAVKKNRTFNLDLYDVTHFVYDCLNFSTMNAKIDNKFITKRFSFLENHSFFYRKFTFSTFYVFEFQGSPAELGEIQNIAIFIPTHPGGSMKSRFYLLQDGIVKKYPLENTPNWYQSLCHEVENEVEKMHRLRRLFKK